MFQSGSNHWFQHQLLSLLMSRWAGPLFQWGCQCQISAISGSPIQYLHLHLSSNHILIKHLEFWHFQLHITFHFQRASSSIRAITKSPNTSHSQTLQPPDTGSIITYLVFKVSYNVLNCPPPILASLFFCWGDQLLFFSSKKSFKVS